MKKYLLLSIQLSTLLLGLFFFVEAFNITLLVDPSSYFSQPTVGAAFLSIGLLTIDVVLPVPSSFVMVANGKLFGLIGGTTLSIIGGTLAACVGFMIGRTSQRWVRFFIKDSERDMVNRWLPVWGISLIILTRPIPILAETVAILAGTTTMRWQTLIISAFLGMLPISALYALTGATLAETQSFLLIFAITVGISAFFLGIGLLLSRRQQYREKTI